DERDPPVVDLDLARFVDDGDVGMIQGRRGPCLSEQPSRAVSVGDVAEHLQRHDASQLQVLSPIHVAHAAGSDPVENAIVRQYLANHANDCRSDGPQKPSDRVEDLKGFNLIKGVSATRPDYGLNTYSGAVVFSPL